MNRRAMYMYGVTLPIGETGLIGNGLGQTLSAGSKNLNKPTMEIGEEGGSLSVDGVDMEFMFVPGGEADRGGLRGGSEAVQYGQSVIYLGGDVITAIAGHPVSGYSDYFAALFDTRAGERVDITVNRNGRSIELKGVVLIEQTEDNSRWLVR